MIAITKLGRLNQYTALVSESEYLEAQTQRFVNKVFGGDAKHLVSALIKQDYFSEDDYEELKNF